MRIFGRDREIQILENIWTSKEAELVAIYGRRRVGKTYLIREYFSNRDIYCEIVGTKDGSMHEQLENFSTAFSKTFYQGIPIKNPKNWKEAFNLLTKEIEKLPRTQKVVIFLDELPWMATPKSNLLQDLDYFWNSQWSRLPNLKIVLCGSAAAWILDNLINAKGGLYNRITKTILLEPFNLFETKMFLKERGVHLNDKHVLDIYMVMGGIAHYLKQIEKGKSAIQNINDICFNKDGLLHTEFPRIFKSLFDESEIHLSIVKAIAKHPYGIDRNQLLTSIGVSSGGTFNKHLTELEAAGFIQNFIPYGKKIKEHYYRVIDEYSLFYLTWIDPYIYKNPGGNKSSYWPSKIKTGAWLNWAGIAFEQICNKHIEQIRLALGLDKISCEIGNWRYVPPKGSKEKGAQIDLLFDRDDNAITICEIKYSDDEFSIDKTYANNLINKLNVFENHFLTKKQIFLSMISTAGVKKNMWYEDLIQAQVYLKHFFIPLP
jgi:AAA+ ATPase superfamily predicted ATPase